MVFFTTFLCAQQRARVAIAYLDGPRVVVADGSGHAIRTVKVSFNKPISGLAINATGTHIVAVLQTFGRGEFGGDFYLWSLRSKRWKRITFGPYVFKEKEEGHREVYDRPAFSPSGKSVGFLIRTESLYDDNDCVMASGPVALMNLSTGKIRVLRTTMQIDQTLRATQDPPFCTESVAWSSDSRTLLECFEDAFGTVDLETLKFHLWDPSVGDGLMSYSVNWLDGAHILFASRRSFEEKASLHRLSLKDGTVSEPPQRFGALTGELMDFNRDVYVIRDEDGGREVHGSIVWKLPKPGIFGLAPVSK